MITLERVFDPAQRVQVDTLKGEQFTTEQNAHTFRVSKKDGSFTGSIAGKFLNAANVSYTLSGSIDGGVAVLTLPATCYAVAGRFLLTITNTVSTDTTVIYAAVGVVENPTGTDGGVPQETIITIEQMMERIEAADAVIDAAQAVIDKAVLYQAQTLTDAQQAQARSNIGAPSEDDFTDLKSAISAKEHDPEASYNDGDLVWRNGNLYRAKWALSPEEWTGGHWVQMSVAADLLDVRALIANPLDKTKAYNVGDYIIYMSKIYRCKTAIPTGGEAWTASHWTAVTTDAMNELKAKINQAITDTDGRLVVLEDRVLDIVPVYNPTVVYQSFDYVIHNDVLYRRKSWDVAPTAEEWTSGHWDSVTTLANEITNTVPLSYFAPYYDASQTYSAGDYVLYNGYIRKAKFDITTPETFTSGHWTTVGSTLFRVIDNIEPNAIFGGQTRGMYRHPVYSTDLLISRLTTTPSSNTTGLRTNIFAIYGPTRIYVSDQTLKVRINEYTTSVTFSNTYKATIRDYSNACDYVVYGATYPMYIAVGIMKPDSSEMTDTDLATISGQFSVMAADDTPYADLSMFQSISVSGDSWSAGAVHSIDGAPAKTVSNIGQGWAENMARQHGVECLNFAIGGTSVRTWFNYDGNTSGIGMKGLLAANAVGLYILSLGGSNDWQSGADGARGWNLGNDDPTSPTYYMGSISDISGNDYTAYPKTFYGYYGRIIEMIQAHAPNSRIIITTPNTFPTSSEKCLACYDATAEIAEHYGLPYLDLRRCDYFNYWRDGRDSVTQGASNSIMNDKHPTAAMYSGMGRSIGKLIPQIIKENAAYFREYNGQLSTVAVSWAPVTK